jgi:hypothetical protein
MVSKTTTIQIDRKTKEILNRVGRKGETYDDVIRRILKSHEYIMFMEEQYRILDTEKDWISLDEL